MIHTKTIISILLLILCGSAFAQPNLNWSFNAADAADVQIASMETKGAITYVTGQFRDSLKLESVELSANGKEDIFLLGMNDSGKPIWGINLGGTELNKATQLTSFGQSVLIGGMQSSLKKGDKDSYLMDQSLFFAAYDTIGKQEWAVYLPFTGRASLDVLETWHDSLIFISGTIKGCILLDGKDYCSNNGEAAFAIIFSKTGKIQNSVFSDGTGNHRNIAACFGVDGSIFLLTAISPGVFVSSRGNKNSGYSAKSNTLIIGKFNNKLEQLWMEPITGDAFIEGIELQTDSLGNVYTGINFNNSILAKGVSLNADSKLAGVVIKWGSDGKLLWAQTIKSPEYCRLMDFITVDGNSLLLAGYHHNGIAVDKTVSENPNSRQNAFLLKLNPNGKFAWYEDIKSEESNYGKAISFDNEGSIYFAGGYMLNDAVNQSKKSIKASHSGAFINKYHICKTNAIKIQASSTSICPGDSISVKAPDGYKSYLWNDSISGNQSFVVGQAGRYKLLASDSFGCMSTDSIDITDGPLSQLNIGEDTTLFPGEYLRLNVDTSYVEYLWEDGYNNRSRYVNYNKDLEELSLILYAKQEEYCLTSDTITIYFDNNNLSDGLQLYPNPVKETLWWTFDTTIDEKVIVELFDARRVLLFRQDYSGMVAGESYNMQMSDYVPGNYYLRIRTEGQVIYRNFIKQ